MYGARGGSPTAKEVEIEDLEHFVAECSYIVGIGIAPPRTILYKLALQLAQFKKNLNTK